MRAYLCLGLGALCCAGAHVAVECGGVHAFAAQVAHSHARCWRRAAGVCTSMRTTRVKQEMRDRRARHARLEVDGCAPLSAKLAREPARERERDRDRDRRRSSRPSPLPPLVRGRADVSTLPNLGRGPAPVRGRPPLDRRDEPPPPTLRGAPLLRFMAPPPPAWASLQPFWCRSRLSGSNVLRNPRHV